MSLTTPLTITEETTEEIEYSPKGATHIASDDPYFFPIDKLYYDRTQVWPPTLSRDGCVAIDAPTVHTLDLLSAYFVEWSRDRQTWTDTYNGFPEDFIVQFGGEYGPLYLRSNRAYSTEYSFCFEEILPDGAEVVPDVKVGGDVRYLCRYDDPDSDTSTYCSMFSGFKCLKDASELVIPKLHCERQCADMFANCSNLEYGPQLPSEYLTRECYIRMFDQCLKLKEMPDLPAKTLGGYCYKYMFRNCRALTSIKYLPATEVVGGCYEEMFSGCSGITTFNGMAAMNTASGCFYRMFMNCISLVNFNQEKLPATVLTPNCYSHMFWGCTRLRESPIICGQQLATDCFHGMFRSCTRLEKVTFLYRGPQITTIDFSRNFLSNVAPRGTFICYNPTPLPFTDGSEQGPFYNYYMIGIPTEWSVSHDVPQL